MRARGEAAQTVPTQAVTALAFPRASRAISSGATDTLAMSPAAPSGLSRSPRIFDGKLMNYMISFALPRFMDQTLTRSRKRALYPAGTPDWVAKLDTVIHELYHIDPEQNCLRRFARADGSVSDALHNPTYFEDVAQLAQQHLASNPNAQLVEFLHDFDVLALRATVEWPASRSVRSFVSAPLSRGRRRPAAARRHSERPR